MKANPEIVVNVNMSLRDYFAAKAMQGLVANSNLKGAKSSHIANDAYQIADAMIEARLK